MNLHASHLSFATIVDWAEQRLSAPDRAAAQTHLAGCARCAAEVARVERLIALMQTDDLEDAPPALIQRAIGLFRPRPASRPLPGTGLRRIIAALHFDSGALRPAMGLRAAQPGSRQMLFHADGHDVDLRLTPTGTEWTVAGQVLGACASGEVELTGPQRSVRALLNQLCEFSLPPVPAGTYTLLVYLSDAVVEVAPLAVGI